MNKVLHIIESFDGQATERWLYQMMCYMKETGILFDWTFFVTLGREGELDDEVKGVGGKIIYSSATIKNKIRFIRSIRHAISAGGFDIVHSHHDVMSAIYLLATIGFPSIKKIVHVHNTALSLPTSSALKNKLIREPMRQVCIQFTDKIVGVSENALGTFLQGTKRNSKRHSVIHCGIDTAPFHRCLPDSKEFNQSVDLPVGSKVLLFVGRMIDYKNPCFVLEVLTHFTKSNPEICVVFAGTGPLEKEVRNIALKKSLQSRVRVLGWHNDIPVLMQSCDMLIWPGQEHIKEGLGLAVVEAQAAGLPVLMSLNVPKEAVVIPELVDALPLAAGASAWAEKIISKLNHTNIARQAALAKIEASTFSIGHSMTDIVALYDK